MTTELELSVVIPNNDEPLLGETVRAVLAVARAEGVEGIEVIVVGAGDWSVLPNDPAVRVVEPKPAVAAGAARNQGLAQARGNLVVFLDGDCQPLPGWLAAIRASQGRGPVVGSGSIVSPDDNFWQSCYNLARFREYLDGLAAGDRSFLPSFCLWGPRQAFLQVGGFAVEWVAAEDLDFSVRLARAGWSLRFEPAARVLHRPTGRSFRNLLRYGWLAGGTSIRARRQYPEAFGGGRLATLPPILALGGAYASAYFLARTFWDRPEARPLSWKSVASIYLYRLAWCLGAAWSTTNRRSAFHRFANR